MYILLTLFHDHFIQFSASQVELKNPTMCKSDRLTYDWKFELLGYKYSHAEYVAFRSVHPIQVHLTQIKVPASV